MTQHPFETLKLRVVVDSVGTISTRISIVGSEFDWEIGHLTVKSEYANQIVALFNAQAKLLSNCKNMARLLEYIHEDRGLNLTQQQALEDALSVIREAEPESKRSEPNAQKAVRDE